jgi:hypothetical protein
MRAVKCVHLTYATVGRVPLAPSPESRLALVRALARVAGGGTAMFAVVDDHAHVVVLGKDAQIASWSRSLLAAWRALGAELLPAHVSPVATRSHAEWLVRYTLTQGMHHGIAGDPATAPGSWFADLVGARRLEGLSLRLGDLLPRFRAREAYAMVGLPMSELSPADDATVARLGWAFVAERAAASLAVASLAGNSAEVVRARCVVAALAAGAGARPREIGSALGLTDRAAARLIARGADPLDVLATRRMIALHLAAEARRRAVLPGR